MNYSENFQSLSFKSLSFKSLSFKSSPFKFTVLLTLLLIIFLKGAPVLSAAYLSNDNQGFLNSVSIVSHTVTGTIESQVARISVTQIFKNVSSSTLDCTYNFPVPQDAGVSSFAFWVDNKKIKGEIKEKNQARQDYENALKSGQTAGLAKVGQQKDSVNDLALQNLFTIKISPLKPGEERKTEIIYSQVLPYHKGKLKYTYPLLNSFNESELRPENILIDITISEDRNIKRVWSELAGVDISSLKNNSCRIFYEGAFDFGVPDLNIYYEIFSENMGLSMISSAESPDQGVFLMSLIPQEDVKKDDKLVKHVSFVIDVSGSMAGSKLDAAKQAFISFINNLNENDLFSVYTFSTNYGIYNPEGPVKADKAGKDGAVNFIRTIYARGGTNIYDTLEAVLTKPMAADIETVVFMTDGDPSAGRSTDMNMINQLVQNKTGEKRLNVFGLGNNVKESFLKSLALQGRGIFASVRDGEDLKTELERFSDMIAVPLMADIRIEVEGVETHDIYPKQFPDLFMGSRLMISGRSTGFGTGRVKISALHKDGLRKEYEYKVNFEQNRDKYSFVKTLWARKKIDYLLKELDKMKINKTYGNELTVQNIKKDIIGLSEKYSIVTPFTSFGAQAPASSFNAVNASSYTAARPGASAPVNSGKALKVITHPNTGPVYQPEKRRISSSPIPLFPLFMPNFSKSRRQSRGKACISNLRTIEGAIEMYLMDQTGPNATLPDNIFDLLVSKKYLKKMPRCHGNGNYTIMDMGTGYYEVVCSVHGSVNTPSYSGNYHGPGHGSGAYKKETHLEKIIKDSAYFYVNASNVWISLVSSFLILGLPFLWIFSKKASLSKGLYYTFFPYILPVNIIVFVISYICRPLCRPLFRPYFRSQQNSQA
jgi:Ca-activated chloride channel family protein